MLVLSNAQRRSLIITQIAENALGALPHKLWSVAPCAAAMPARHVQLVAGNTTAPQCLCKHSTSTQMGLPHQDLSV